MKLPIEEAKRQLLDVYESRFFPMYLLVGGIFAYGFTTDIIWVLIALGGFVYFTFKRR